MAPDITIFKWKSDSNLNYRENARSFYAIARTSRQLPVCNVPNECRCIIRILPLRILEKFLKIGLLNDFWSTVALYYCINNYIYK